MAHIDNSVTYNRYISNVTNYYENRGTVSHEMSYQEKMERLPLALLNIMPMMKTQRSWFSICKVLMDIQLVGNGDFKNAVGLIAEKLDDHNLKIDYSELQKLDVQSLTKDVSQWKSNDSPFGNNTPEHQTIYYAFMGAMMK